MKMNKDFWKKYFNLDVLDYSLLLHSPNTFFPDCNEEDPSKANDNIVQLMSVTWEDLLGKEEKERIDQMVDDELNE